MATFTHRHKHYSLFKVMCLCLFWLLICQKGQGQKEDSHWFIESSIPKVHQVDFSKNKLLKYIKPLPCNCGFTSVRASIADNAGKLLMFSNGMRIFDRRDSIMKGGDSIFINYALDDNLLFGIVFYQGAILLPQIDNPGYYYLFYLADNGTQNIPQYFQPTALYYAIIDMHLNGGNGAVIAKNNLILQDTLSDSRMAACKHADGKSWWLIKPEYLSNKYYKFLIDETGIHGPFEQRIGGTFREGDAAGWASFSADGNHFATATGRSDIWIFDFDRCTGNFSNPRSVVMPFDTFGFDGNGANGVNFSESGHYLYANSITTIMQYKLDTDFMPISQIDVTPSFKWDSIENWITASYAPDHKIYVGRNNYLGVSRIDAPETEGRACNVVRDDFGIKNFLGSGILPYLPVFALGTSPVHADSVNAGLDTVICAGEYLKIGGVNYRNIRYHWQSTDGAWSSDSCNPVVSPLETTTYYVRIADKYIDSSCALKYDTVTVTVKDQCPTVRFPTFIDKAKQPLFVVHPLTVGSSLTLYNSIGQKIHQQANYNNDFSTQNLPNGVYIYNYVNGGDGKQFRGKVEVME